MRFWVSCCLRHSIPDSYGNVPCCIAHGHCVSKDDAFLIIVRAYTQLNPQSSELDNYRHHLIKVFHIQHGPLYGILSPVAAFLFFAFFYQSQRKCIEHVYSISDSGLRRLPGQGFAAKLSYLEVPLTQT